MVTAVGSSSNSPTPARAAARPVSLDAELAKFQKQLSDNVNCDSAKTPEGKAKIEEISTRINAIKAKMKDSEETTAEARDAKRDSEKVQQARSGSATPAQDTDPARPAAAGDPAGGSQPNASPTLGAYVDVYA